MRIVFLLAAPAMLGACMMADPAPEMPADSCGAEQMQHMVGQRVPNPFPAEGPVRVYETGQPVTMDYHANRVNVETTSRGRIVAISCG